MTFNQFQEVIAELSNKPIESMKGNAAFREDLAIDSLQMVYLIEEISERYGVDLSVISSTEDFRTVANLYQCFFGGNYEKNIL